MFSLPNRLSRAHARLSSPVNAVLVLQGGVIGALTGLMFGFPTVAQANVVESSPSLYVAQRAAPSRTVVLGVAQTPENASAWPTLDTRLDQLGIPYRPLDWNAIQQEEDLAGITVLFLPNVASISPRQLSVLQAWTNQGGHIIASGNLGGSSSTSVQSGLRSLMGAYWAFALPQPSTIRLNSRRLPVSEPDDDITIAGGVVVPTGLQSHTVATWQTSASIPSGRNSQRTRVDTPGAPAVVMTDHTTFLGWDWGNTATADATVDVTWMQAVLDTVGAGAIASASEPESRTVPSASTLLTHQIHRLEPGRPGDLETATPSESRSPQRTTAVPQPAPNPAAEPSHPNSQDEAARSPAAPPTPPAINRPHPSQSDPQNAPQSDHQRVPQGNRLAAEVARSRAPRPVFPAPLLDPAEQIAPAGLEVEQSSAPISILESISMQQELENLIGRFESALLAASALMDGAAPIALSDDSTLIASTDPSLGVEGAIANQSTPNTYAQLMSNPALVEAREILDTFPDLVARRDYGEARRQWLDARQALWANFPTDRPLAQPEVRAIWLDRGTIVRAGSRRGLATIFDRLSEAGINTVFVETVNAGYPIYPSRVAPRQNPLIRRWDPLAAAVDLAHERDMEVHAWVWVFAAGNQRHNTIVGLPQSYPGPILEAHPDWANYDHRGEPIPLGQNKPFLDPANPAVRSYLLRLYEEIVTQYDVDGLQLDYIRYPFQDPSARRSYGYGTASRQRFQQITGVDPVTISPSDRALWERWTEFRTEQVNSFVADVAAQMRSLRPDIVLSAAVFPMSEHERLQKLQQHWEVWAREGDVDMIVPMSYAMDTNRLQRMTAPWLVNADLGSVLVVPGIQLLDLPEPAALDQIQALRDMPAGGYALFAVEHLNDNLSGIFSRTQGSAQTPLVPVPFRAPFQVAASRFEALQREWNFMLSSGELWMRSPQRDEWQTQTQELQETLNQLSEDSSSQQIRQAQRSLQEFRDRFDEWMYLQALSHSYRVQIWEYRLAMIDNLLDYGSDRQR